jgi:1,4-alpha-glucan branching enzyme
MTTRKRNSAKNGSVLHRAVLEVTFSIHQNGARNVYVAGEFNHWSPSGLRMIPNREAGLWVKKLVLAPGRYEYKFVVDGVWTPDPNAHEWAPNAFGSLNSVVEVVSN